VIEPAIQRYFDILGLEPTASEAEIREARNFVTKAFHPDKYELGSKDQARAHEKQIEINEAYERLLDWVRNRHGAPGQDLVSGAPAHNPGNPQRAAGWSSGGRASNGGRASSGQASSWQVRFGANNRQRLVSTLKIVVTIFLAVEWILTIVSWFPGTPLSGKADAGESKIMIAVLVLSSLGAVWFMLAPEAKVLIEMWTKDSQS